MQYFVVHEARDKVLVVANDLEFLTTPEVQDMMEALGIQSEKVEVFDGAYNAVKALMVMTSMQGVEITGEWIVRQAQDRVNVKVEPEMVFGMAKAQKEHKNVYIEEAAAMRDGRKVLFQK